MRTRTVSRRTFAACAAAAVAALRSAPVHADTTIYEYEFTDFSFDPTTVATDLIGSPFGYVNANPGNPPFVAARVFHGFPGDPTYYASQADWYPTSDGYNSNYFTMEVSVQPGFSFNANSLTFLCNSRSIVFDMQVLYSNNSNFSNPVKFDTTQFVTPTNSNWNNFTASSSQITNGVGTYYFRFNGTVDPSGTGTISDSLNLANVALNGSVQTYSGTTPMCWDPGNIGAPGSGGTGTWLTSNTWADGAFDYNWSDPTIAESANFAGTAGGVVALGGSVSATHGINFLTAGYNITGAAGQTLTVAGALTANADATISCAMSVSGSTLTKAGTASLTLAGSTTFSPGASLAVNAGTLKLVNNIAPSGTNVIASGAVLEFNTSGAVFQKSTTITGTGALRVTSSSPGSEFVFGGGGLVNINLSPGALIDVESGKLVGSSSYDGVWTRNFASLNVAMGAIFDAVEGGPTDSLQIDALTGGGQFTGGYSGNSSAGLTTLTIGNAGGGGTFSGNLSDDSGARLGIIKTGGGTETFTGSNTYSGGTTISAGALNFSGPGALPVGSPVTNNAAMNVFANNTSGRITGAGALTIGAAGTAATLKIASGSGTGTLGSLMIAGTSRLDITNTTLKINFGSPANDPTTTIAGYLKTGYNGGLWTGVEINSSTAAAGSPGETLSVGYADGNADVGTAAGPNQVVVKYTLAGDANLDSAVGFTDLVAVVQNFNKSNTDWAHGNFTYAASTNFNDLVAVVQNFNKTLTPAGSSGEQLGGVTMPLVRGTAVELPEPGMIGLAASGAAGFLLRRKRGRTRH